MKTVLPTIEPSKMVVFNFLFILNIERIPKTSPENAIIIAIVPAIKIQVLALAKLTYQKLLIIKHGSAI